MTQKKNSTLNQKVKSDPGGNRNMLLMETKPTKKLKTLFKKRVAPSQNGSIAIDYPKNGEAILPQHYAIRVGSTEDLVEIAVDGGEWQACRKAGGYHWYDWYNISQGGHKCVARMKLDSGKYKKSKAVAFKTLPVPETNPQ